VQQTWVFRRSLCLVLMPLHFHHRHVILNNPTAYRHTSPTHIATLFGENRNWLPLWRSVFALVGLSSLKTFIFEFVRLLYFCCNSQMCKPWEVPELTLTPLISWLLSYSDSRTWTFVYTNIYLQQYDVYILSWGVASTIKKTLKRSTRVVLFAK